MATLSAGTALENMAVDSPHVDVVRYEHKNVKWTLKHVNYYSDGLATGLLETGLKPGDAILSWLPSHFSEQHILQFACSKAGFVLYQLDPSQAITDPEGSKEALKKALELTEANILITQEAGNDTNYVNLVETVIPETLIFNVGDGLPFFTPRFPHLRYAIHTGFDFENKAGMIPFNQMLCPSGKLPNLLEGANINGKTPLMGELILGEDLVPTGIGKVLSNEEVVNTGSWPEFSSILKKDFKEIEGVGVVF